MIRASFTVNRNHFRAFPRPRNLPSRSFINRAMTKPLNNVFVPLMLTDLLNIVSKTLFYACHRMKIGERGHLTQLSCFSLFLSWSRVKFCLGSSERSSCMRVGGQQVDLGLVVPVHLLHQNFAAAGLPYRVWVEMGGCTPDHGLVTIGVCFARWGELWGASSHVTARWAGEGRWTRVSSMLVGVCVQITCPLVSFSAGVSYRDISMKFIAYKYERGFVSLRSGILVVLKCLVGQPTNYPAGKIAHWFSSFGMSKLI